MAEARRFVIQHTMRGRGHWHIGLYSAQTQAQEWGAFRQAYARAKLLGRCSLRTKRVVVSRTSWPLV